MTRARKEYLPQILYQKDEQAQAWKSASVFKSADGHFSLFAPTLDEARAAIEAELANQADHVNGRAIVGTRILERIVTDWEEVAS
jgi:hypothetical protein